MATGDRGGVRKLHSPTEHARSDYVVPVVHVHLSEPVVKLGFYGGLAGAVALGTIDLPVAVLLGVGVAIARHRRA